MFSSARYNAIIFVIMKQNFGILNWPFILPFVDNFGEDDHTHTADDVFGFI